MEEKALVQLLRDRIEIIDVVCRYAASIDARHWEGYASCFTDQIQLNLLATGGWVTMSRDAFVEACRKFFMQLDATQHISANHQVSISGDEAICHSTLNATHFRANDPGGQFQRQIGSYVYHLVRANGWQIDKFDQIVRWEEGNQEIFARALANVQLPAPVEDALEPLG